MLLWDFMALQMALRDSCPHALCFPGPRGLSAPEFFSIPAHLLEASRTTATSSSGSPSSFLSLCMLLPHDTMQRSWTLESDRPGLVSYLTSYVTLSKLLNLPETELLHTRDGIGDTCFNRPVASTCLAPWNKAETQSMSVPILQSSAQACGSLGRGKELQPEAPGPE